MPAVLTEYLTRRTASRALRLPGPAPVVARTILETCVLWAVHLYWDPAGDREQPPPDVVAATLAGLLTHGLVARRNQTMGKALSSDRLRAKWDKYAPRYDRDIGFFERMQFGASREWVCSQAHRDFLEVAVGTAATCCSTRTACG